MGGPITQYSSIYCALVWPALYSVLKEIFEITFSLQCTGLLTD